MRVRETCIAVSYNYTVHSIIVASCQVYIVVLYIYIYIYIYTNEDSFFRLFCFFFDKDSEKLRIMINYYGHQCSSCYFLENPDWLYYSCILIIIIYSCS